MKSLTINNIEVTYHYHKEQEQWYDKNGDPGTPESTEITIISPEELIDDEDTLLKILEHET